MLRHIVALFAAVLVGLAVFAWIESYSSSFQNCVSQESAKTTSNQSKEDNIRANPATGYAVPTMAFEEEQAIVDEAHRQGVKAACTAHAGIGVRQSILAGLPGDIRR
jgi:hypothetical protein